MLGAFGCEAGTYLDLVDIADGMVELNRPSLFHISCMLGRSSIQSLHSGWSRGVRIPSDRRMGSGRIALRGRLTALLNGTEPVERCTLSRSLRHGTVSSLSRRAKLRLRALDAVMNRALPICWTLLLQETLAWGRRWSRYRLWLDPRSWTDGVDGGARGCRHSDAVWVILEAAFDSVARWQEGVESLDQVRVSSEKLGNTSNYARRIDSASSQWPMSPSRLGITHVWLLKSFIISRNLLYTSGCSENWTLTWSR